jgi:large subunit ribosomal protein L22
MEYQATAKYVRTSTRKLRLIADAVRGLDVTAALTALSHMNKAAAEPMGKTLASAVANAKQKGTEADGLTVKAVEVMGGPAMKRFHAVSRGMAHSYKKRMTHVRVIVATKEKTEGAK